MTFGTGLGAMIAASLTKKGGIDIGPTYEYDGLLAASKTTIKAQLAWVWRTRSTARMTLERGRLRVTRVVLLRAKFRPPSDKLPR